MGDFLIEKAIVVLTSHSEYLTLKVAQDWGRNSAAGKQCHSPLCFISFRSRKFQNFMENCMIKNFLFRPTSGNMLHHPFVHDIKNERRVVESLTKHLTGIIQKRERKGRNYQVLYRRDKIYIYLLLLVLKYLFKNLVLDGGGTRELIQQIESPKFSSHQLCVVAHNYP